MPLFLTVQQYILSQSSRQAVCVSVSFIDGRVFKAPRFIIQLYIITVLAASFPVSLNHRKLQLFAFVQVYKHNSFIVTEPWKANTLLTEINKKIKLDGKFLIKNH